MIPTAALALAACLPVQATSDQIAAADLARALPEWSAVAGDSAVALAPNPGVIRIFRIVELRRLAERFNVATEPAREVCFERPVAPVPAERMLPIMQARLPDARIEILESSRAPVPEGELEFPLSGLRPGYWHGYVTYGAGHRFVVWARVNIKIPVKRIVASADLNPGQPVDAAQLRIETREEFPSAAMREVIAVDGLAGRVPRRRIPAGSVVALQWLDPPRLVQKGDTVLVEVTSGSARIEAECVAESSGALGEFISVQNPDSKRRFRARVESPGHVSVKGRL